MARLLEEAHWLYEKDVSSVLFPRSYNLSREPKAFLDDFRLTAAAGLLKWFVGRMQDGQGFSESGHRPILMSRLEFAIKRCEEFIAREIHQNIDKDFVTEFSEEEWNSFLDDYTAAVHEGAGIETTSEKSRDQLQGRTLTIQLETLHFLNLSRSDSYLQYRHSGEIRRGEEETEETWKFGGSRKIDSRSRMGLREAERIFKANGARRRTLLRQDLYENVGSHSSDDAGLPGAHGQTTM